MKHPTAEIQNVKDGRLTLSIDGEIQEIKDQLETLRQLLAEKEVNSIQYADKIYNIQQIDQANFGFITGKQAFNAHLTEALIQSIQPICAPARRFFDKVKGITDWQHQMRFSNKAKEIIAYSFVGVIGIQLSKLMAIGKEDFSEAKQRKYIRKCSHITEYSLDLVNFVLLSSLWDQRKEASKQLDSQLQQIIKQRLQNTFAPSLEERYQLLQVLFQLFEQHQLPFPIEELPTLSPDINSTSRLTEAVKASQELRLRLEKEQYNMLDCFEAEQRLAQFLHHLAFLVNYNMASIKQIGYREIRNDAPVYLHRFTALGLDSKANVDAEKIMGTEDTVQTDAVLFYRGNDYKRNINLYPFVIDYNTLAAEYGAKICFFQNLCLEDDSLDFVFLEDNSIVNIEQQDIFQPDIDLGTVMMDEERRKIFNLNCVVKGFEQAKHSILNDLSTPE